MVNLQLLLFAVGLSVAFIASGGLIFTIREFRRFDRESAEKVERLEAQRRASKQRPRKVVGLSSDSKDKKYVGADI